MAWPSVFATIRVMRWTTKRAAEAAGISPATLRNWTRRGLLHVRRDWRGARVLTDTDVARLRQLAGVGPE
jgi:DNA-binding transcriptional MerR regulator